MFFSNILNIVTVTPFIGCFVLFFISDFEKKKL
jgi:hypothetical protein